MEGQVVEAKAIEERATERVAELEKLRVGTTQSLKSLSLKL